MKIEVKNYRCFSDAAPARFEIKPGFTAIVGQNNAGKSALLRFIYEMRPLFVFLSEGGQALGSVLAGQPHSIGVHGVDDRDEIFFNGNDRDIEIIFSLPKRNESGDLFEIDALHLRIDRSTYHFHFRVETRPNVLTSGSYSIDFNDMLSEQEGAGRVDYRPYKSCFHDFSRSCYIGPFRNAIQTGQLADYSYYDVRIGQNFVQQWQSMKTGPVRRDNIAITALTNRIRDIFGFSTLSIEATPSAESLLVTINGWPYRLGEIGAGLSHFVLGLTAVATLRPKFVLVDEPELSLHPSLQLDLLEVLSQFGVEGVVYATHSIGLARSGADRVYSVRRVAGAHSEVHPFDSTPSAGEFLGELSFAGYQELGATAVLAVEGPTELRVFRQLLRLYGLDHQVVCLPGHGTNLINGDADEQLGEIKRLASLSFAIVDSERTRENEELDSRRSEFLRLCQAHDIPCLVTSRRATENYFPDHAVKAALGDSHQALGPYQSLKDAGTPWGKRENWRIAGKLTRADLAGTDLDEFLTTIKEAIHEASDSPANAVATAEYSPGPEAAG
jgi:AAA ATPase domain